MSNQPVNRDVLLGSLSMHVGEHNGVHIRNLVGDDPAAQRHARELILELRLLGHHICAHPSAGYYMAQTPEELDRTCEFLYGRALTSLKQIAAMRRISLPDLRGQLRLPT